MDATSNRGVWAAATEATTRRAPTFTFMGAFIIYYLRATKSTKSSPQRTLVAGGYMSVTRRQFLTRLGAAGGASLLYESMTGLGLLAQATQAPFGLQGR